MFEGLSQKLQGVFRKVRGEGHLTERNIRDSLREIRLALLEADVNFQVVKDLVERVRERALGDEVLRSITPGQQFVKVVQDAIEGVLGDGSRGLNRPPSGKPGTLMLVGLQGSGKTSTAGKLARRLHGAGRSPLLVPCDVYRPAAIDQLRRVSRDAGVAFHEPGDGRDPLVISRQGVEAANRGGHDIVIVDTAGRLHIDDALMDELKRLESQLQPFEILDVADSMTGQDAVRSAGEFHRQLPLTGVVLTKMDGDARGGAALSIKHVTGLPIKLVGTGEKLEDLEDFHPERMTTRILGMGDVVSLVEKAEAVFEEDEARRLEKKLRGKEGLTLDDFREQLRKLQSMGSMSQLLEMIPGVGGNLPAGDLDERELKRVEAILDSMTAGERKDHSILNGSRKRRVAKGSGTTVPEVNRLLKQFVQMRKMMKTMADGARRGKRGFPNPRKGLTGTRRNRAGGARGGRTLVTIRLRRMGTKKKPFYRLVVSDSRKVPTSRVLESVGYYDPKPTPALVEVNLERADFWLGKGAQPSPTVRELIQRARGRAA